MTVEYKISISFLSINSLNVPSNRRHHTPCYYVSTSGDPGSSLFREIPLRSGIPLAGVGPADGDHGHHPYARQRELPSLREVLLQPGLPGPHPQKAQAGEPKVRRGLEGAGKQLCLSVLGHALLPYAAHAGAGHDDEDNNNDDEGNLPIPVIIFTEDPPPSAAHGRDPQSTAEGLFRATSLR